MTQIALITGANRGLGLETARRLAQSGATVVVAARDARAGEDAAAALRTEGLDAESVRLDVTAEDSVQSAVAEVGERHGRLDVLINNAGILPEATSATEEFIDLARFRETFDTNLFGAVSVVQQFLPLLRSAEAARIVNVSTTMGSLTDASDPNSPYYGVVVPAYQASKTALNAVTVALSKLLADTAISVVSVCPGFVQTDLTPMNRSQAPLTAKDASHVVAQAALGQSLVSGSFTDSAGVVAW